jgi:heme-degrading monooxygenase HmoA
MYARVTTGMTKPGVEEDGVRIWHEIHAEYEDVEAFVGGYLLLNAETRQAISITLWTSESGSRDVLRSGRGQQVFARLGNLFEGQPRIEGYAVADHV